MGLFSNLKTEGLEETEDRIGGFQIFETDAYLATVKLAYAGKSDGGASNMTFEFELEGGKTYKETIYVTNRKGENFFLNKDDNSKKVQLPGFAIVDELMQVTLDKPLADVEFEEKVVKIYDYETKKELPKSVQVPTELLGKQVILGIQKQTVNKNEKDANGVYVPTADTREENVIVKIFHNPTTLTVPEVRKAQKAEKEPEALYYAAWVEKNKGVTRDNRKNKTGEAGTSGKPGAGAPTSGGAAAPRKSLFGG